DLDDVDGALGHAVGQFLDGDDVRNGDFAAELGRGLLVAAHLLVAAAAHGGKRGTAIAVALDTGIGDGQAAAAGIVAAGTAGGTLGRGAAGAAGILELGGIDDRAP